MDKALMLNQIQKEYGFKTDTEFADHLGIKPQVLSNWKKRNTYDAELLFTKCEDLPLSAEWLLTGKGNMIKASVRTEPINENLRFFGAFESEALAHARQAVTLKEEVVQSQRETIESQKETIEAQRETILYLKQENLSFKKASKTAKSNNH
jgi:hypothetical protein